MRCVKFARASNCRKMARNDDRERGSWKGADMPATMMLKEIANYPVEDRIMMADAIIESLNGSNPEIDAAWNAVSRRRLGELRTGKVKGISAVTVLSRARALCRA